MLISETAPVPTHSSHLFILRIWRENLGDDQFEWRAYVRHVSSGESHYFRKWEDLQAFLTTMSCPPPDDRQGFPQA